MKQLLQKILYYLVPVFIFLLITTFYHHYSKEEVFSTLTSISKYECIIMGDSQMQRLNKDQFDIPTFNFASSGEHFYFTYHKLNLLINNNSNHNIKNIILGISAHSFSTSFSRKFNLNTPAGKSSLSKYFYFIPLDEDNFMKPSDIITKSAIKGIYKGPEWGGSFISNNSNPSISSINRTLREHYDSSQIITNNSSKQIKYLLKINDLCNKEGINLTLVSLPYHHNYLKNVEDIYFNILNIAVNSTKQTHYINFLERNMNPELMSDANHLNTKGGALFSKMINDSINHFSLN